MKSIKGVSNIRFRKILAILSVFTMISSLSGCDEMELSGESKIGTVETVQSTNESSKSEIITKNETTESEVAIETQAPAPQQEEQVIYNDNGVLIVYTGMEQADIFSNAKFNFRIENNSDKKIVISTDNVSVNGYTVSNLLYEEIAAGKKSNTSINLYNYEMEENNISTINYIEFMFNCIDAESYSTMFDTEITKITINEGTETENTVDANSQLVFEQDGISVYYTGNEESDWITDLSLKFQIVNNSDKNITISSDACSVNDYAISSAVLYTNVAAGKKSNDKLSIYSSELETNGIDNVEKVEFSLKCHDSDSFDTIWETEPIIITMN